jgi:hypothetical protein
LLLVVPGAIHLLHRYKINAVGLVSSFVISYGLYIEYDDFWPDNIFRFHAIHYLSWTFPLLALITYVGLKEAWRYRVGRWSFYSVPLLLFATCFIALRDEVTSEISQPTAAMVQIPFERSKSADWILFVGSKTVPPLLAQRNELVRLREYKAITRVDGTAVILSTSARSETIDFDPHKAEGLRGVRLGRLSWRTQWMPRWPTAISAPKIVFFGKPGIDIGGPAGVPDGQPDDVIQIDLQQAELQKVSVWDVETTDHHGHVISIPNAYGWWLIKVKTDIEAGQTLGTGRTRIWLCFPDSADIDNAPGITVRALDGEGGVVFEKMRNSR